MNIVGKNNVFRPQEEPAPEAEGPTTEVRGWTETDLRIPKNALEKDITQAEKVPFAWGTFGRVKNGKVKSAFDPNFGVEVRSVSEIIKPRKRSLFSRLCTFFGV